MKTKPSFLPILIAAIATLSWPAQAIVKNAAQLQGNLLADGSIDLTSATPQSILWNLGSSVDPILFEHDLVDGSKLKVLKDGDYLVAVTVPYSALPTAADNRPAQTTEMYVNGVVVPGAIGQSSYIRNQPRNANIQLESSDHVHTLLRGLKAGDTIEVRVNKYGVVANVTQISPAATVYVELVDSSRSVFAGLTSGPTDGNTNLRRDVTAGDQPAPLGWISIRKDAGFTHTAGSQGISLTAGAYLIFVNVPLQGAVTRGSISGRLLLNSVAVEGTGFHQGFIRNTGGHNRASIHFAGVIQVTGNQTLTVQLHQRAALSTSTTAITIQPNKQGSIYIERLGASGVFRATAATVDSAVDPTDWNPTEKTALVWQTANLNDASLYNHTANTKSIQVRQAGNYFLVYNDMLQSTVARPNPKITVQVNGADVRGAETKCHYIRSTDGHNHSSAALAITLEGLKANDNITISTQAEGNTGLVIIDECETFGAMVALIKKDEADFGGVKIPPRFVGFGGDAKGWFIRLQELNVSIDDTSLAAKVNGAAVTTTASRQGSFVTLSHSYPPISDPSYPDAGMVFDVVVNFRDKEVPAGSHEAIASITVPKTFAKILPKYAALSVDTTKPGFIGEMTQINEVQVGINNRWFHNNQITLAEQQHSGLAADLSGVPYRNQVNPNWETATSWVVSPFETQLVNYEQAAGSAGNFNGGNGYQDALFPKLGPGEDPDFTADDPDSDGLTAVFRTWLDLKPGVHTMGVNSDDLFKVTTGFSPHDQQAVVFEQNGGRGAADSLFDIVVYEAGRYPFRLLWWEGRSGASLEWFMVVNGEKILINDTSKPNATLAYREGKGRPAILSASPQGRGGFAKIEIKIDPGIGLNNLKLSVDGREAAHQTAQSEGFTTVSFDNGRLFAPGNHTYTLSFDEATSPPAARSQQFSFTIAGGLSAVLADNPFAYWRFAECSGDQAFSEVGTGFTARYLNGPTLGGDRVVAGDGGGAVLLDAAKQQWIDIPDSFFINDANLGARQNDGWKEKTVEMWIQPRKLPTSAPAVAGAAFSQRQVLFEQGGATRGINVYLSGTQAGPNPTEAELWFNVLNRAEQAWGGTLPVDNQGATPNGPAVAVSTKIQAGKPAHIVLVMKGDNSAVDSFNGTLTGYLNGQKFGEATGVHLLYNHTDDIAVGARNEQVVFHDHIVDNAATLSPLIFAAGEMFYYDGWIGGLALYNRALSAAQVKAHYDAGLVQVAAVPCAPAGGAAKIMSYQVQGGKLIVTWEGTSISTAPAVTGPFTQVAGAVPGRTEFAIQQQGNLFILVR